MLKFDVIAGGLRREVPVRVCPREREVLTPRDIEILDLIVADPSATRRQLGAELGIGEDAVKAHLKRIFRVLPAESKTQAALIWERKRRTEELRAA